MRYAVTKATGGAGPSTGTSKSGATHMACAAWEVGDGQFLFD